MTATAQPGDLVSVIIPTHNRAALLPAAIESCLVQTHAAIEVLVIDDGSTDDTERVVAGYDHPAIRYHRTPNRGGGAARNTGLDLARGRYVKFLDSDDALIPDALARQVAHDRALDDPRAIVTGDFLRCDAMLGKGSVWRAPDAVIASGTYSLEMVIIANPMTSCPLYPRAALLDIGGFDTQVPIQQDYDLAVRIVLAGYRYRYFPDVVYRWRVHRLTPRVSQTRPGTAAAHVALIEHHHRLLVAAFPDGPPPAVLTALGKKAAMTSLRVAHSGHLREARQLAALARNAPGPLGLRLNLEIALALSGLATLAGHLYRRFT